MASHISDEELAARLAGGDAAAFETLYRRHVDRVWRYALIRARDPDAAADIVQDAFLRIARTAAGYAGRSAFSTWLYSVVRSVAIDHARRRKREAVRRERLREASPQLRLAMASAADEEEARDREALVRECIAKLPGAQRDALVLFELVGMSVRECAAVLEWGESRVRTTLHRGRRRLRELLASRMDLNVEGARRAGRMS